jgi:hypothetical protein
MQIPWKRVAIAVLIVLVLVFVFFSNRKKERFETPPTCTPDQDEIDGTCYARCREGFSATGTNCYEVCKPDERSEGPVCISSDGSSRTVSSYARSPASNVQAPVAETIVECDEGYDSFSGFCIEKCKDGFTKTGFMCMGNCPSNMKTLGIMCADDTKSTLKESYFPSSKFPKNKDMSNATSCPDGYTINGATCIENCPSDHILKGSFCMEKCNSDETDLDTMCLKGQSLRKKRISVPRVSTVPIKTISI